MGLDIYVGPLTRYYAGTWKTVVQQAAEGLGVHFETVRRVAEPVDRVTDPGTIADAVRGWQRVLSQGLEVDVAWPESGDLPYWTDKPDWDGYGAVVMLASYQVCPELTPSAKRGFLSRRINPELPRQFNESPAYKAAVKKAGGDYPSLILGSEWWLPVTGGPAVFQVADLAGANKRMSRVSVLLDELTRLNEATLRLDERLQEEARQRGPATADQPVDEIAPFGLAVLLRLAEHAATAGQPLLLDY